MGGAKLALVLGTALAVAVPASDSAAGGRSGRSHAHSGSGHRGHSHGHRGFFYGGIIYTGPYFYYPGYYYPYYGVPLYDPGPGDPYWYYCRAANAYYPYVQNCPGGWERYLPSPPSPLG